MSTYKTYTAFALAAGLVAGAALISDGLPTAEASRPWHKRRIQKRPKIEVAFVLDTTGSMGGLLEGAKRKVWSIASKIASGQPTPEVKIGLVAYRDVNDDYVTKRFDLTKDLDSVYTNLQSFQAGGGGDTPEHVGRGLGEAVSRLSWSQNPGTMKLIFLVGDAPPQTYQDGWDFRNWSKQAAKKHIVVNTVRCGSLSGTPAAFQEIARLTQGTYASIDASGGMIATTTPYDGKIAALNSKIAGLSLFSGRRSARRRAKEKAEAVSSMPAEAAADRIGFMRAAGKKGAGFAAPSAPGAVDLLAQPSKVASISDDELPEELAKLSEGERKQAVEKRAKQRKKLEEQVRKLSHERNEWMKKNVEEKEDSFDANVMKDIKARAAEYGIAY